MSFFLVNLITCKLSSCINCVTILMYLCLLWTQLKGYKAPPEPVKQTVGAWRIFCIMFLFKTHTVINVSFIFISLLVFFPFFPSFYTVKQQHGECHLHMLLPGCSNRRHCVCLFICTLSLWITCERQLVTVLWVRDCLEFLSLIQKCRSMNSPLPSTDKRLSIYA